MLKFIYISSFIFDKYKLCKGDTKLDKKYQVFISSTYMDLIEPRAKVRDAILSMMHFPVGMEMFNASDEDQWKIIQDTIDSSDFYVLIIAQRYGSVFEEGPNTGMSYTEKEYRYAQKIGLPTLIFVINDDVPLKKEFIETSAQKNEKLEKFKAEVKKNRMIQEWSTSDELARKVCESLHKEIVKKKRPGWVRGDDFCFHEIPHMDDNKLLKLQESIGYEIIRRNNDIRLAYDFMDNISNKIIHSIRKQTYIDNFNREIVLEILNNQLKVSITTRIEYINIKDGIIYYSANPRFETYEQAMSYKHEEYTINGVDYSSQIQSSIECTNEKRQFPFLVRNQLPLIYDENVILIHKTSHIIPVKHFFHVYQLVLPCRSFLTTVIIKGNDSDLYDLKTGTFSSFNVHTYEKHTSEYRKDDVSTITIGKWSLPGSGYTISLQQK